MGLFAAALSERVHDAHVRNLVGSINASVEALERLFSALMDISKLDAGAVSPRRAQFPLATLFERIARDFTPVAAAKGLRLAVVPTRLWVDSDPVLLERILANLVSNAVRYTARGGGVMGVRRRGACVSIEVWDSGVGIPAAERDRVFEEFYQIDTSSRSGSEGMGLGLAIIRRLAALLAHPVRIDSEPGRGSRFSVEVPRAIPALSMVAGASLPPGHAPALVGAKVAVIDDETIVVEAMRALFAAWGAEVFGATSAPEMLSALADAGTCPDLLIADYRLTRNELGTDAIAGLRSELGPSLPALLISGDSSTATLSALRSSGLEFLLKPVLPEELKRVSARLLAVAREAAADCAPRSPTRAIH
jgi:CheY-like chemotaxis protein/two-component sensor histidine kinase